MDKNKVYINGAWIDKEYLNENINEAKKVSWRETILKKDENHNHCIICGVAISGIDPSKCYESNIGWLCNSCFNEFIK